jgi:queuine tRNA-ribosyltransferase
MLLTWHNLTYYQDLMAGLRGAIAAGTAQAFAQSCARNWIAEMEPAAD